jgi:hypothetical protein
MTATLRISQVAERSGFRPSALRYYEQVGLLAAVELDTGALTFDVTAPQDAADFVVDLVGTAE